MKKLIGVVDIVRWAALSVLSVIFFIQGGWLIGFIFFWISLVYELDTLRHRGIDRKIELITKALELLNGRPLHHGVYK